MAISSCFRKGKTQSCVPGKWTRMRILWVKHEGHWRRDMTDARLVFQSICSQSFVLIFGMTLKKGMAKHVEMAHGSVGWLLIHNVVVKKDGEQNFDQRRNSGKSECDPRLPTNSWRRLSTKHNPKCNKPSRTKALGLSFKSVLAWCCGCFFEMRGTV